ncbi:hypothetical protein [Nonomuraea jabiensis]|uniref:Uncharacterized protein n=1 Tax=Nonomuraea jabiensis TaxID=882448 RepID=A0A7W9GCD4_9ACTN|nr:hypothetical protein [Nonomuraea jabiensis]MBB5781192.1 hypothetical protein [Nonomuraea jabiensis]
MESHFEAREGAEPHHQWCLVYDVESSRVVHLHQHLAVSSDAALATEQLAEAALAQVPSGLSRERLAVAHPDPGVELGPDMTYVIDPESGRVTARPDAQTFYETR